MPLNDYGVWMGKFQAIFAPTSPLDNHICLSLDEGTPSTRRASLATALINVRSSSDFANSGLVYWILQELEPQVALHNLMLSGCRGGWNNITGEEGLDLIGGLVKYPSAGVLAAPGQNITNYIEHSVQKAINRNAMAYVFGQLQGNTIHNIHVNQGSKARWKKENSPYCDGAILVDFPDGSWDALFLAFTGQTVPGNPTGDTFLTRAHSRPIQQLMDSPKEPLADEIHIPHIGIVALIPNPPGTGGHLVELCNMTGLEMDVGAWKLGSDYGPLHTI